jgi:catechol 2,3-dioxygenase-like lactoylglutathione lyase family enzyme
VKLTGLATVLLVDDVARTADYYCDALGFETSRFEANPDHYGYASRDGCHVHFARFEGARPRPNHEEAPPDMFDVYLWVDDVDALHEELVGRGAELLHGRSTRSTACGRSVSAIRTATCSHSAPAWARSDVPAVPARSP